MQADNTHTLFLWLCVWSCDFASTEKGMVIVHDTECPYWDKGETKYCLNQKLDTKVMMNIYKEYNKFASNVFVKLWVPSGMQYAELQCLALASEDTLNSPQRMTL